MGAFSSYVTQQRRKPPRTIVLPPSAFADTWEGKPSSPVMIGLKLIAEGDMMSARTVAAQRAERDHSDLGPTDDVWIEAYNQALMHYAIATGTCHPDNIAAPYWDLAYDVVPMALSQGGAERLFDALEELKVTESPLSPEATNEDLAELAELLRDGAAWERLRDGDRRAVRRMARRMLEQMRPVS